ncbi:hypothetical protein SmJEL517_g03404 [Synchytrium microbalum]|uniref:AP-3 complex subunit delta n=1 Tax=Synchytrium microbalum TaxID=1806994 RepID=A0A507C2S3_9FUNG|nr:uncharacterized protein SmJEL517_g03404 [Synchytrium microbalum]TPX33731.1 hypothetical protein SmJEL517_g03404 [Synchytrium microbalum]
MFEKTLTDLIRGLRANKKNEDKYVALCLDEIRQEVRKNDPDIKAMAISKLSYLHMMGYDMSWASFHIIEVMSSPKLPYKRIGYSAAAYSFKQDTDVLMLCTNLIKKDLSSNNHLETAVALGGLAMIVTPDLGRDLTQDLIVMLTHSRPYLRKRAILVLYKVFLKYPEALRMAFPRLKEKLDDADPSVVSAVVGVICELARKNPKNYLPLAPQLYGLLTNSSNNWMLIKIIKLFAALAPIEPRLVKKLIPPITNLIQSTPAMSLLYECILTIITGGMISPPSDDPEVERTDLALTHLCVTKLKLFIEDPDQNLKYLGLYALSKLLPIRPAAVADHRDIVIRCLDDGDISIRMRALDLVSGMVSQENLVDVVRKLMTHVLPTQAEDQPTQSVSLGLGPAELSYRQEVVNRIIAICSRDTYADITNFEWYIDTLAQLIQASNVRVGQLIGQQMLDVVVRVTEVSEHAVSVANSLLLESDILATIENELNNIDVLYALAWICGENCRYLSQPTAVLRHMLLPAVKRLPVVIQSVYIHNAMKIFSYWINMPSTKEAPIDELKAITNMTLEGLALFTTSIDLEVQERACTNHTILSLVAHQITSDELPPIISELPQLFLGDFKPVNPKAQKRVPIPEGLDLDKWIHAPPAEPVFEEKDEPDVYSLLDPASKKGYQELIEDDETIETRRRERDELRKRDPFYIPGSSQSSPTLLRDDLDIDSIPIVKLNLDSLPQSNSSSSKPKKTKKSKKSTAKELFPVGPAVPKKSYNINRASDMPDGAADREDDDASAAELQRRRQQDPEWRVHEIDLFAPEPEVPVEQTPITTAMKSKKSKESSNIETDQVKKKKKTAGKQDDGKGNGTKPKKKKRIAAIASPPPPASSSTRPLSGYEALSSPVAAPLDVTPAVERRDRPLARVVASDTNLTVNVDWTTTTTSEPGKIPIRVTLGLLNTSPGLLSEVEFHFNDPPNATAESGNPTIKIDGFVTSRYETYLDLDLTGLMEGESKSCAPIAIDSGVVYKIGNSMQRVSFSLVIPATINFIPMEKVTSELFTSLLADSNLFPYTASTQFAIPDLAKFPSTATSLAAYLRLSVVEIVGAGVSILGRAHNSYVAGLIKGRPKPAKPGASATSGVVSVELKGSDRALIDAILEEISDYGVASLE